MMGLAGASREWVCAAIRFFFRLFLLSAPT